MGLTLRDCTELLSANADALEVRESTVVEPLVVVCYVKESMYTSSSLLSSSPDICSGEDGLASKSDVSAQTGQQRHPY